MNSEGVIGTRMRRFTLRWTPERNDERPATVTMTPAALGPFTPDAARRAQGCGHEDPAMKIVPLSDRHRFVRRAGGDRPPAARQHPGARRLPADHRLFELRRRHRPAASRPSSDCWPATAPSAPSPAMAGAARARPPCASAPAPARMRPGCSTPSAALIPARPRGPVSLSTLRRPALRDAAAAHADRKPARASPKRDGGSTAVRQHRLPCAPSSSSPRSCAFRHRAAPAPGWHLVPGSLEPNRGPDGNSVFLDAPEGLILVDTGRHPDHRDRLLAYARARGRPIAAIVNTHWHLDHSTGNGEIRAAFPDAPLYASNAIDGALAGFLRRSRESAERALAAGPDPRGEPGRDPARLRGDGPSRDAPPDPPGHPLRRDDDRRPAAAREPRPLRRDRGRRLALRPRRAAGHRRRPRRRRRCRSWTRPAPKAGARALDAIAATPFTTLIPGHGAPMDRRGLPRLARRVQRLRRLRRLGPAPRRLHRRLAPGRGALHPRRARGDGRAAGRLLYRQPPALGAGGAAALLPGGGG